MAKLITRLYENTANNEKTNGKIYGRVFHTETLNIRQLARHIADHGSPFTPDTIEGVIRATTTCLVEQLMESKKVKLNGLGTFYLSAESTGAASTDEFTADNIKKLHIRFLPEQTKIDEECLSGTATRATSSLSFIDIVGSPAKSGGSGSDDDGDPVVEHA